MRPTGLGPGRAWIITPALREDRYAAASTTPGAGVALVDLEDSVPQADKQRARVQAHHFFARHPGHAGESSGDWCVLGLRLNSPATLEGIRDLATIAAYTDKPALVLVPKVQAARDIEQVAATLDTTGYRPQIWALIETPRALQDLPAVLAAPRLAGVVFGAADYAAEVGCRCAWEPLVWARSALVNGAAAAGLPAIDSPYFDLHDLEGMRRESEHARELGFWGKGAVHPRQVPVIDQVFTPSAADLTHARAVVGTGPDSGVTTVGTRMVGPPLVAAARQLLRDNPTPGGTP